MPAADQTRELQTMGVRKEGSGKSRGVEHAQGGGSTMRTVSSGASTADPAGNQSDEDSDSELQEVYVQAYACKVFNDGAAAAAVEGGEHLRPLAVPQDPEGEPLMLDRFDARWMLDLADFSKGFGSRISTALAAEEEEADSLRYAGLPSGDHSVEVDGLGKFAPSGSYAHGGVRGGLGDEEEEEPPPEVYGYYGRTAAPPSSSSRGAYAATPAPQDPDGFGAGATGGVSLSAGPPGTAVDGDNKSPEAGFSGDGGDAVQVAKVEVFVPDFGVPQGLAVPSTTRQHIMMVGTARTAVRSPQLEVLLRLKQASNEAFSFLSHDDPIHPYYVFLKSWGEAALGKEYARQQRLQVERAEAKLKAEADEKDRAAAAAKAASMTSQQPPPPPLPPPPLPPAPTDESDGESDAPNLLGGAYDSSGDEEDAPTPPGAAAAAATATGAIGSASFRAGAGGGGGGGGHVVEVVAPDEAKREVVEKMVAFVARNGQAFEDRVREREKAKSTFDFLVPSNKFYPYYKARLALARGETPASSVPSTGGAANSAGNASTGRHSNSAAAAATAATAAPVTPLGGVGAPAAAAAVAGPNDSTVAAGGASAIGRSAGGGVRDAPGRRATSSPSPPPHAGQQWAPASVGGAGANPGTPQDSQQRVVGESGVVSGAVTDGGGGGGGAFEGNGDRRDPAARPETSGIGLDESSEDHYADGASFGSLTTSNGRSAAAAAADAADDTAAGGDGGGSGRVGGRGAGAASAGRSSRSSVSAGFRANGEIVGYGEGIADGGEGTTARSNSSSSEEDGGGDGGGGGGGGDGGGGSGGAVGDTDSPGAGNESALMMQGMSVSLPLAGVNGAAVAAAGAAAAAAAADDAETRRANRLKRARLMTGHYKLAVMEHSSGQEAAADGGQQQQGGAVLGETASGMGPGPSYDGGVDGSDASSSADGLSDFDDESSSDDDAGDDVDDDDDDVDDSDVGDDDDDDDDGREEDSKRERRADSGATRDRVGDSGGLKGSGGDRGRSGSHADSRRRRAEDDAARRWHDVGRKSGPSHAGSGKSGGVWSSASRRDDRGSAVRRRSRSRSGSRDRGGGDRERDTRARETREERAMRGRNRDNKDRSSRERTARLDKKASSSRGSGDKRREGGRNERDTVSERPPRGASPELRRTEAGAGRGKDRNSSSRGDRADDNRSRRRSSANETRSSASSSALGGREGARETRGDRGSTGSGRRGENDVREEKGRESRERRSGGRRRSGSREREDSRERVGSKRSRRR